MNSIESSLSWGDIIRQFIDELNEADKLEEYRRLLVCEFYKYNVLQAANKFDCSNKKAIEKLTGKNFLRAKPQALESIENELELKYLDLLNKGLLIDSQDQLNQLKAKSNFYNIWICRCLIDGEGILPATHVAKLSHSSSGASSLYDQIDARSNRYITTSNLKNIVADGAYPDAFFSKQAKFLLLKRNGILLSQELLSGSSAPLREFAKDDNELNKLVQAFQTNLTMPNKSDALAKQIYFPVVNNKYHSLTILISSSMSQALHNKYFEQSIKKSREFLNKKHRSEKYDKDILYLLPKVAKLATVASQPQNVSVLSSSRAGKLSLLSCQPPTWQSQLKPPIYKKSLFFDPSIYVQVKESIDYLRDFLIRFEHLDLSIKDPKRMKWIEQWVGEIIDEAFFYITNIQNLSCGWSDVSNINLKLEHQYLLDPYRNDADFQTGLSNTDWQSVVCKDFADWLNMQLVGKDKQFTPQAQHTRLWCQLFDPELRDLIQIVKLNRKHNTEAK